MPMQPCSPGLTGPVQLPSGASDVMEEPRMVSMGACLEPQLGHERLFVVYLRRVRASGQDFSVGPEIHDVASCDAAHESFPGLARPHLPIALPVAHTSTH